MRRNPGSAMKSAFVKNCVGRCSQSHSDDDYGECVVAMHVPPIKDTAQVTFEVVDGTEPTLSMPMLVANGNREAYRGEDAMSITAEGETAPLTSDGDDWYLKVLINNSNEFIRIDVWTPCHVCPPSWVRNLSTEMKQREQYVVRETTGMWDHDTVTKPKNNSSPEQTGAAGKTRNTQMLEDVEEPMPTERYQTNEESAISPLEETDILLLSRDEEIEVLRSLSSWNPYVMDDAELLKDLRGLGKPPLFENDTAKTANSEVQESIKGLNDKHSKFEIEQGNVTDTPSARFRPSITENRSITEILAKARVNVQAKGKGKYVDVVETNRPSETASTVLAIVGGDADESMDMVRPEEEAFHGIEGAKAARSSPS